MSFLDGLKHLFEGKPIFQPPTQSQPVNGELSDAAPGNKPYPKVMVEEVKSNLNGNRLEVYAYIKNYSQEDVMLDKMRLLGERRELDETLKANDRRQVLVYSGPAPQDTSANDAELQYHDMQNGYFFSRHDVRFKEQQPRVFTVERMPYENTSQV